MQKGLSGPRGSLVLAPFLGKWHKGIGFEGIQVSLAKELFQLFLLGFFRSFFGSIKMRNRIFLNGREYCICSLQVQLTTPLFVGNPGNRSCTALRFLVRKRSPLREIHGDRHLKLLLLDPRNVPEIHRPQQVFKDLGQFVFSRAPSLVFLQKDGSTPFPLFAKLTCFKLH